MLPNIPIPLSHPIDFHSSPTESPFKCLFLSELSLTTAASKRNEWFLNLRFSSDVCVFLFDHVIWSYCGSLFTWPSSQAPRVDSVLFLFLFPGPGWVPSFGRCSEAMKGIVLKPCFWHWNQGTWLYSLCTAQTCLGLGVSGGLGLPSARGALLSPRGASWQVGRGGLLQICTKMLYRLALFATGRPKCHFKNGRMWRNSSLKRIASLVKSFHNSFH